MQLLGGLANLICQAPQLGRGFLLPSSGRLQLRLSLPRLIFEGLEGGDGKEIPVLHGEQAQGLYGIGNLPSRQNQRALWAKPIERQSLSNHLQPLLVGLQLAAPGLAHPLDVQPPRLQGLVHLE